MTKYKIEKTTGSFARSLATGLIQSTNGDGKVRTFRAAAFCQRVGKNKEEAATKSELEAGKRVITKLRNKLNPSNKSTTTSTTDQGSTNVTFNTTTGDNAPQTLTQNNYTALIFTADNSITFATNTTASVVVIGGGGSNGNGNFNGGGAGSAVYLQNITLQANVQYSISFETAGSVIFSSSSSSQSCTAYYGSLVNQGETASSNFPNTTLIYGGQGGLGGDYYIDNGNNSSLISIATPLGYKLYIGGGGGGSYNSGYKVYAGQPGYGFGGNSGDPEYAYVPSSSFGVVGQNIGYGSGAGGPGGAVTAPTASPGAVVMWFAN
jgi:hypothetical protein